MYYAVSFEVFYIDPHELGLGLVVIILYVGLFVCLSFVRMFK